MMRRKRSLTSQLILYSNVKQHFGCVTSVHMRQEFSTFVIGLRISQKNKNKKTQNKKPKYTTDKKRNKNSLDARKQFYGFYLYLHRRQANISAVPRLFMEWWTQPVMMSIRIPLLFEVNRQRARQIGKNQTPTPATTKTVSIASAKPINSHMFYLYRNGYFSDRTSIRNGMAAFSLWDVL